MDKLGCFLAGTITGVVGLGILACLSEKCGLLDKIGSESAADKDDETGSSIAEDAEVKTTSPCSPEIGVGEKLSGCKTV